MLSFILSFLVYTFDIIILYPGFKYKHLIKYS